MYRITIEQEQSDTSENAQGPRWVEIYRQCPAEIDLVKIISAVNAKPRKPRVIAIHAAKGFPPECRKFASVERGLGRVPERIPCGAIVAIATLMGCRYTHDIAHQLTGLERHLGDYSLGRYAWFLSDMIALPEPIPCKGALSLWPVPIEIQNEMLAALSPLPNGQYYSKQSDGHNMLCNADGTRSIFDDVDE